MAKFAVSKAILYLMPLLVLTCGIRQGLYQILRAENRYKLYTISILSYQILLILGFLSILKFIHTAEAIVIAMIIAILSIDILIVNCIKLKAGICFRLEKKILENILKYALPLVMTNVCYYLILYIPNFIFQSRHQYINTSVFGASLLLSTSIIVPISELFIFVNLPPIIKRYERGKDCTKYFTNVIQTFLIILIPIICSITFFSKDIVSILFPKEYSASAILLPLITLSVFAHSFMKLINIKYHLIIKTYVEFFIALIISLIYVSIIMAFANNYTIIIAAILIVLAEFSLLILNSLTIQQSINCKSILKTFAKTLLISILCAILTILLFMNFNGAFIIKILFCAGMNYYLIYKLKNQILML